MPTENGKYTVIELSELLGVKRTTVNDWLAKYAVYMDFSVQGKRRIYSDSTLTVLKKIAELRGQGKSSFDIDSTLAKLYAVHPQPEPENVTETPVNDGAGQGKTDGGMTESLPQRIEYQSEQAEELLRQFRAMMEKIDRLEAAAAALPPPAEPVKKKPDLLLWTGLIALLIIGLVAVSLIGYRKLTALQEQSAAQENALQEQQAALRLQIAENEKQATAREQLLKNQAEQEKTIRLAAEKQLEIEKQLAAEKAAKTAAEHQKQVAEHEKQLSELRLKAEKATENYQALEKALKARENQFKAEQQLAEKQISEVRQKLEQATKDLATAKNTGSAQQQTAAAEVKKLQDQIRTLEASVSKSGKELAQMKKAAAAADAARKKVEAENARIREELKSKTSNQIQ